MIIFFLFRILFEAFRIIINFFCFTYFFIISSAGFLFSIFRYPFFSFSTRNFIVFYWFLRFFRVIFCFLNVVSFAIRALFFRLISKTLSLPESPSFLLIFFGLLCCCCSPSALESPSIAISFGGMVFFSRECRGLKIKGACLSSTSVLFIGFSILSCSDPPGFLLSILSPR
jgi:hypothetical protein